MNVSAKKNFTLIEGQLLSESNLDKINQRGPHIKTGIIFIEKIIHSICFNLTSRVITITE
jgi:hypothetical protein